MTPKAESFSRVSLQVIREDSATYDPILDPKAAAEFLADQIGDKPQEHMVAAYLDTRGRPLGWQVAFVGGLNRATVEPRPFLQMGLLLNAASVLLAHNHPSGDTAPSVEDLAFTRRLDRALEAIGLRLLDHIIVADKNRFLSLRQAGGWVEN